MIVVHALFGVYYAPSKQKLAKRKEQYYAEKIKSANPWDTEFSVDKKPKRRYNEDEVLPKIKTAFEDATTASTALDYLYAPENQSKASPFLKNNGFPSAADRLLNKQLYGAADEHKHMLDLLKSKTDSILKPALPNATDRAFLQGLMGEKEGDRDYQNQLSTAIRAQTDLQNAFRGSPFEGKLKPLSSISDLQETKHLTDSSHEPANTYELNKAKNLNTENDPVQDAISKTIPSVTTSIRNSDDQNIYAYSEDKINSETEPQNPNSDYNEFYLSGQTSVYNRLKKLGSAWLNTTDESARNELHAEANLLRCLARNHTSPDELTFFPANAALNNVLENNNAIYKASEATGVPVDMIASALYRESLFHDPLDNPFAESVIYSLRGDASFGIGQVRTQTAIEAENAFYEAHGMPAPNRTQDEMKERLQKDDTTNILYVALVLWHCGQKLTPKIDISTNYDYANADDVFQKYNPGSKGHGEKVGNYVPAFHDYYEAVR